MHESFKPHVNCKRDRHSSLVGVQHYLSEAELTTASCVHYSDLLLVLQDSVGAHKIDVVWCAIQLHVLLQILSGILSANSGLRG